MAVKHSTEITIPLAQLMVLTALVLLTLVTGRQKLGVSITFFFLLYWGYIHNREVLVSALGATPSRSTILYLAGGSLSLTAFGNFMYQIVRHD